MNQIMQFRITIMADSAVVSQKRNTKTNSIYFYGFCLILILFAWKKIFPHLKSITESSLQFKLYHRIGPIKKNKWEAIHSVLLKSSARKIFPCINSWLFNHQLLLFCFWILWIQFLHNELGIVNNYKINVLNLLIKSLLLFSILLISQI